MPRIAGIALSLILCSLLAVSCTMDVDMVTDVQSPDSIVETSTISMEISEELVKGLSDLSSESESESSSESLENFGPNLSEQMQTQIAEMREKGYDVTEDVGPMRYSMTAQKEFTLEEWLKEQGTTVTNTRRLRVKESDGKRTYSLQINFPKDSAATKPSLPGSPSSGATSKEMEQLKEFLQMKLRWSVTLPGEITDTNADRVEDGTAFWELDLTSGQKPTRWYVNSVEVMSD
jgi:hypothetical protein